MLLSPLLVMPTAAVEVEMVEESEVMVEAGVAVG